MTKPGVIAHQPYEEDFYSAVRSASGFVLEGAPAVPVPLQRRQLARVDVPPEQARGWVVTASFRGQQDQQYFLGDQVFAYLEILWGTGNATHRALVSLRRGMVVPVQGASVQVNLVMPGALLTPESWPLTVAASIVPGDRMPAVAPVFSCPCESVPVETEVEFGIPPFASRAQLHAHATNDNAFGYRLTFRRYVLAAFDEISTFEVSASSAATEYGRHGTWFDVPSDASHVAVYNSSPSVVLQNATVMFRLQL